MLNKFGNFKKSFLLLIIVAIISGCAKNSSNIKNDKIEVEEEIIIPICDGISVTSDCEINNVLYKKYKYHPAIKEVFHYEKKIAGYKKVVVGYCTMCNDGTRSPSCSTGRGTCSHHGGVSEWNAPIYKEEPYYEQVKVIDIYAKDEWYEIIEK